VARKVVCLLTLGLTLVFAATACSPGVGGASSTPSATWPPANQVAIGSIPTTTLNVMGQAFTPAPQDAQPAISQSQAEKDALTGTPNIFGSADPTIIVRHAYLVAEVDKSAPNHTSLMWVVDISPPNPFPSLSGGYPGNVLGVTQNPSQTPESRTPEKYAWVTVNATTGAYDLWYA
jgi:hypothetical protein